jgi:hypothetical protein
MGSQVEQPWLDSALTPLCPPPGPRCPRMASAVSLKSSGRGTWGAEQAARHRWASREFSKLPPQPG